MRVCIYHTPCILSYAIYVHHLLQYVSSLSYTPVYTEEETLDMNGANRVSTLFSGTSIITVRGGVQQQGQGEQDQLEEASYNSGTNLLTMCIYVHEQYYTCAHTPLFIASCILPYYHTLYTLINTLHPTHARIQLSPSPPITVLSHTYSAPGSARPKGTCCR